MNKTFIAFILLVFISCKKQQDKTVIAFNNTEWNTYFKYNGFTFFAQKKLQLLEDKTCLEIGISDTIMGTWEQNSLDKLQINLEDNSIIQATTITNDSLYGTKTNLGNTAIWYAIRR